MSPFRVAPAQSSDQREIDRVAWFNLGMPAWERVSYRPTNLCCGTLRGTKDTHCNQYGGWQHGGLLYCQWHRPPGSERR